MASIYALVDPRTNEVRYVGQTNFLLTDRLDGHLSACKVFTHHCANWIKSLLREELKPNIILLEECSIEELDEREIHWIAYGKAQGWRLTNATEGGGGIRGYKHSIETRNKLRETHSGERNHNYGKPRSKETKYKIGKANSKPVSEEVIKQMKITFCLNGPLTERDVIDIRNQLASGVSQQELAKSYKVHRNTINNIKRRRTWDWLKGE